jgi:hypothetical protein
MKYGGEEKRRFKRVNTLLHILIRIHSENWESILSRINGTVLNLSKDSFFIETKEELLEGSRLSFPIYSKREKLQYQVKGIISQKRENGVVVMVTEFQPPDIVITDFIVDEMDRIH